MRNKLCMIMGIMLSLSVWAHEQYPFSSKPQQAQFEHLIHDLRCMVCRHQNLAESDAPLAVDMKHMIYEKVKAGQTDSEIQQFLTDRYGDVILFKPPFKAMTWGLWLAPLMFVVLGLSVFLKNIVTTRKHD